MLDPRLLLLLHHLLLRSPRKVGRLSSCESEKSACCAGYPSNDERYSLCCGPSQLGARLAQREGVEVACLIQIGQAMVDEPVCRLVRPDRFDHVEECRLGTHTPIVDGDLWGGDVNPLGDEALLQVGDTVSARPSADAPDC